MFSYINETLTTTSNDLFTRNSYLISSQIIVYSL